MSAFESNWYTDEDYATVPRLHTQASDLVHLIARDPRLNTRMADVLTLLEWADTTVSNPQAWNTVTAMLDEVDECGGDSDKMFETLKALVWAGYVRVRPVGKLFAFYALSDHAARQSVDSGEGVLTDLPSATSGEYTWLTQAVYFSRKRAEATV
jgi:hypothetical protein